MRSPAPPCFLTEADAKPGYLGSTCEADGGATSSVVDFSELGLWLVRAELAPGNPAYVEFRAR